MLHTHVTLRAVHCACALYMCVHHVCVLKDEVQLGVASVTTHTYMLRCVLYAMCVHDVCVCIMYVC